MQLNHLNVDRIGFNQNKKYRIAFLIISRKQNLAKLVSALEIELSYYLFIYFFKPSLAFFNDSSTLDAIDKYSNACPFVMSGSSS